MTRRSRDWDKDLSQDLRDPEFCREFILASLDEGLSLQVVLGKVIRAYGIAEFAKKVKMASPNLIRAINPKHNPTQETMNRLLRPFGLRLTVTTIEKSKTRSAS
jgi:DNA-binding phage protein